jgi:hypothetical protein
LLLTERFGPIRFYPEEIKAMFTTEFPMQTILKLNLVLQGLRKKAGKEATEMNIEKDEFGFYFKKEKRTPLFVGYWLSFWNDGQMLHRR